VMPLDTLECDIKRSEICKFRWCKLGITLTYDYPIHCSTYSLLHVVGCCGLIVLPRDVVGDEERASLFPFHNNLLYRQLMSSVGDQYRAGKSQVSDHNSAEAPGIIRALKRST
jgi:hypothetical protein